MVAVISRLKRVFEGRPGSEEPYQVIVVQHAEPQDGVADRGLSERGREQAAAFASSMKPGDIDVFVTGPVRASVETAGAMQSAIGGELVMLDEFGDPLDGDGSGGDRNLVDRFLRGLDEIRARFAPSRRVMVVSGGERTLGAVSTMRSDSQIEVEAPGTLEQGIPSCAMTTFVWQDGAWDVEIIAALTIPDI